MADATVPADMVLGGRQTVERPARRKPDNDFVIGSKAGVLSAEERGSGSQAAHDYTPFKAKGLRGLLQSLFGAEPQVGWLRPKLAIRLLLRT